MTTGFPQQGISVEQFLQYLQSYLTDLYRKSVRASIPGYGPQWVESHVYADLEEARRSIETSGFGPQTPYYYEVLQYYSSVAGYLNPLLEYYQATQPSQQIGGYEVEAQGGYNFAVVRDQAGNIIDLRSLGQAEAEGLTAWQQAQLANWNQEFQLQQQQFQAQQQQVQMQQQQAMMPYGQMTAYQKAQMGLAEQAQWAETMSMPPSGWIEQWYRMQGMKPDYTCAPKSPKMTWPEYNRKLKQTQERATEAIAGWERGQSLPSANDMPLRGNWIYPTPGEPRPGAITGTVTEPGISPMVQGMGGYPQAAQYAGMYAKPGVYGGIYPQYGTQADFSRPAGMAYQPVSYPRKATSTEGLVPMISKMGAAPQASEYKNIYYDPDTGAKVTVIEKSEKPAGPTYGAGTKKTVPQPPKPTTPPAPPGLSQFVPSQVTGQPITRAPTTTPSGQMWQATPWSTQEMLRGYTQYAGYRPFEDIMGHMRAMQPATPPGAGRQFWTPARQWA